MFRQADCKHVPFGLNYKENTTTIPQKASWLAAFCFFVFNALCFVQRILLSSSEPTALALLFSDPACFSFIDEFDNLLFAFWPPIHLSKLLLHILSVLIDQKISWGSVKCSRKLESKKESFSASTTMSNLCVSPQFGKRGRTKVLVLSRRYDC